MAKTHKKVFDGIFAQLEETDGDVVLFDAKGSPSVIFSMTNPVPRLCTDPERYMLFQDVLANIVQTSAKGTPFRSRTYSAARATTTRYPTARNT